MEQDPTKVLAHGTILTPALIGEGYSVADPPAPDPLGDVDPAVRANREARNAADDLRARVEAAHSALAAVLADGALNHIAVADTIFGQWGTLDPDVRANVDWEQWYLAASVFAQLAVADSNFAVAQSRPR